MEPLEALNVVVQVCNGFSCNAADREMINTALRTLAGLVPDAEPAEPAAPLIANRETRRTATRNSKVKA